MTRTYVTDARHFTATLDPFVDVPGPARRLGEHVGRVIEAASACGPGRGISETAIRCRRRPGRRPCPGRLHVQLPDTGEILWRCPRCDENGVISCWERTPWDLSGLPLPGADAVRVLLDEPEYRAVEAADVLDTEARAIVVRARSTPRGILLLGDTADMEELRDHVAAEANHERRRGRQVALDRAYAAIAQALGWTS